MTTYDPIAVVGIACRFPGVSSPTELANLLRSGRCEIGPVSTDRRALWELGERSPAAAGLLEAIDHFDRIPFRISATEAPLIDPQQRLVLEMAWHALEDAGLSPACLDGVPAGVFVGAGSSDYAIRMAKAAIAAKSNPHLPNAAQNGAISGRVSYCLGLTGPSLTIDTACSSALAAVASASDALRLNQCDLALAGGVNALLAGETFEALATTSLLSTSGETRSFDAAADGFVRSEGCGMLVLKRLSDATAQGDRIHAVLLGWATGQDGRSNGLSAPSRQGQARVISAALRSAGITPDDIGAIEAHGSGAVLSDTIETSALAEVFAERAGPVGALGSIKANLGHLEAAGGIAGLLKAVLMVRDGFVPMQPAFAVPSPRIEWAELPFAVPQVTRDWLGPKRIVGVSAFGMSGLNAHVIVGGPDGTEPILEREPAPWMFLLSAATPQALSARAEQLAAALQEPEVDMSRLAAAVSRRWAGMSLRAGFLASDVTEAQAAAKRIMTDPPQTAVRLVGKVMLEPPEGLSLSDMTLLCRVCPDLVSATDADTSNAAPLRREFEHGTWTVPEVVLALHKAGATILPQVMISGNPLAPDLPGYPFFRQRYWYDDVPGPRRR